MAETGTGRRRIEIFEDLLGLFPTGSLVDLGAGHGKFAAVASNAGWEVTAVDARTERWLAAPGVTWVQADVREFEIERFDLVVCLGLFYHLTLEDQLDLLQRCRGVPAIIDTHLANGRSTHPLTDEIEARGFRGRLYGEGAGLKSSWGNSQSFWPTPDSFHQMLTDSGFDVILVVEPWYLPDRTFFLALPKRGGGA
jgi:SAM-dependent methyltransferase